LSQLLDPALYTHSVFALPIGLVAALAITVGVWVVWHERARPISVSFFAATLAMATYLVGFSFMVRSASYDVALFWGKVAYLGVPFIVPAIYQFSMDMLGLRHARGTYIRAAWLVGIAYAILAVATDILVSGVFRMEWGYITRITLWNVPILIWSGGIVAMAVRDYILAYRDADPVQRARIRLFLIPIIIASAGFIDYAPSLGVPVGPWGFMVYPVFLLSAARAVARYQLPDLTVAFAADKIIHTMAEPLMVCDVTGRIAIANPAASRLLGWAVDELEGQNLHHVFGHGSAMFLLERAGGGGAFELEAADRGGEPIAVSVSTNSLYGPGRQKVGTVVVARDIRERQRAALEIERREQRFRALTENALDTITILDGKGVVTYESPSVGEVLGWEPSELVGTNVFDRVHPDGVGDVRALFDDLIQHAGRRVGSECLLRHGNGHYIVFQFVATNLLAHPAVRGVVLNGRDVTEERYLAAELQQAQKMEAIGRLAGGVAHDFNNILTAIQGNVAIMAEQVGEDSPCAPELEEIRRGADRAGRLTDQLLSFSRRQVVQPEVLDLNEVVEEMRDMLERLIGEGIELVTELDRDPGPIRADRGQVEQVLMNLLVNARDAVGGSGRVEVTTVNDVVTSADARAAEFQLEPGSYVVLGVADDGHGMDEETRARIFEPFFTTKESGRGTGLGLSTVYGSVRQAGGFIGVRSRPGKGTRFLVYFPRLDRSALAEKREQPRARSGRPVEGSGEVILVVEDERPVRKLMARVLERRGYRVLQAENGEEALAIAGESDQTIDLMVADLVMPGLNGREVAERLAEAQPDVAVVFISGYTADEVVRQGIVAGQHEFLPKPFTPDTLVEKVATVLRGRSRLPTARSA
jgi:two-component system cell cycle sensor histidine kinase/response regulator CckA